MIYLNNRTDEASSSNLKIWGLLKLDANSTAYGLTATALPRHSGAVKPNGCIRDY